jgi:hypothetical protein
VLRNVKSKKSVRKGKQGCEHVYAKSSGNLIVRLVVELLAPANYIINEWRRKDANEKKAADYNKNGKRN